MEIIYSDNLITNGEADSLSGWTGQADVINSTFGVRSKSNIQQKAILNPKAKVIKFTAEFLPDELYNDNNGYGDVSMLLHCTKQDNIIVLPNAIE